MTALAFPVGCSWFEDPIFDTTEETENGKAVRGDDWRRLMCLREQAAARSAKGEMVAVAGTTFRAGAIERVLRPAWMEGVHWAGRTVCGSVQSRRIRTTAQRCAWRSMGSTSVTFRVARRSHCTPRRRS